MTVVKQMEHTFDVLTKNNEEINKKIEEYILNEVPELVRLEETVYYYGPDGKEQDVSVADAVGIYMDNEDTPAYSEFNIHPFEDDLIAFTITLTYHGIYPAADDNTEIAKASRTDSFMISAEVDEDGSFNITSVSICN